MLRFLQGRKKQTQPPSGRAKPMVPAGMRLYVIGDIHGRSDLLDEQHRLIGVDLEAAPTPTACLIYLGDYIDRGPDSAGVLERLAAGPPREVNVTLLRGNHEEMLLRFLEDPSAGTLWRQFGAIDTLLSYGVNFIKDLPDKGFAALSGQLKEKLPPHHLGLLKSLGTSVWIGDYFFCHAGVRPGIPLERQRDGDLLWIRGDFLASTADFGKIVVHGHSPVAEPEFHTNRINIDTGAYASSRLTCLVLESSSHRFLST